MRTLVVGRSAYADIVLADASIALHHAELVITDDGRYFITDCASEAGTWRQKDQDTGGSGWAPVRQAFVRSDEPLRLGDHLTTAAELAGESRTERSTEPRPLGDGDGHGNGGGTERSRGRVERHPVTGEIIRRRR
ncbi:MAG: FHA domain-containing protein [Geminicoccaceae bacterium]